MPDTKKDSHIALFVGCAITVCMLLFYILKPALLVLIDYKVCDFLFRASHSRETTGIPVIVDVDEKSLARFGQWPWPRYRIAALLEKINRSGASCIALDMLFGETDRTSPCVIKKDILKERKIDFNISGLPEEWTDNDRVLAKTLSQGPFVLGYQFAFGPGPGAKTDCRLHPLPVVVHGDDPFQQTGAVFSASDVICNIPILAESVRASGFLNAAPDADGVLRRSPLIIEHHGKIYPSLALAALVHARNSAEKEGNRSSEIVLKVDSARVESLKIDSVTIPLDARGNLLIHYRGSGETFDYVSAADVLNDRIPKDRFKDKIVFIGTSAAGLKEIRSTPLDAVFPGVEVHATVVDNILRGDPLTRPHPIALIELLLIVGFGLASTVLIMRFKAGGGAVILGAGAAGLWFGARWILQAKGILISPTMPVIALGANATALYLLKYRQEERKVRHRTRDLMISQDFAMQCLASLAETRDNETGGHIIRTQRYIRALCDHLSKSKRFLANLSKETVELMVKAAPLHDIGKVGVPDRILLKPGRLTDEEFEQMKEHTTFGSETIRRAEARVGGYSRNNSFLKLAKDIAHSHHERWDGKGYPRGLKGDEIPLAGRLMALADVYDALISKRVYKDPIPHEQAVQLILEGRGAQFDPDVVDAFSKVAEQFRKIALELSDHEEERALLAWEKEP